MTLSLGINKRCVLIFLHPPPPLAAGLITLDCSHQFKYSSPRLEGVIFEGTPLIMFISSCGQQLALSKQVHKDMYLEYQRIAERQLQVMEKEIKYRGLAWLVQAHVRSSDAQSQGCVCMTQNQQCPLWKANSQSIGEKPVPLVTTAALCPGLTLAPGPTLAPAASSSSLQEG